MFERQEQGISIGAARFKNLELSKWRLSNFGSFGYAIKNILSARYRFKVRNIFFAFLQTPPTWRTTAFKPLPLSRTQLEMAVSRMSSHTSSSIVISWYYVYGIYLRDEEASTVKFILELTSLWWCTICASNEIQVVLLHHLFCFSKFYFTLSTKTGHRFASGRKAYRKAFKHKTVKNLWKCFK